MKKFILDENLLNAIVHHFRQGFFQGLNYDNLTQLLRALTTLKEFKEEPKEDKKIQEVKETIEQNTKNN